MEKRIGTQKGIPVHQVDEGQFTCITACGGKRGRSLIESRGFFFIECEKCKTVNRISANNMNSGGAFTGYESEGNYDETAPLVEFMADKFVAATTKKFLKYLEGYQINITGAKILEVGCGKGRFLEVVKSKASEVTGIEPTKRSFVKARKRLKEAAFSGDYLSGGIKTEYDIIFLNHVFEHIRDIDRLMHALTENLRRNGTIVITIPNVESALAQANIGFWYQLDPEYHEHFVTFSGMKMICERHGLEVAARFTYFPEIDQFSFAYTKLNEKEGRRIDAQAKLKSSALAMAFSSPLRAFKLFWFYLSSPKKLVNWRKRCLGDSVTYLIKNKSTAH